MDPQENLRGTSCICEGDKLANHSFCVECYDALPESLKRELWETGVAPYAAGFGKAVEWLRANTHRLETTGRLEFGHGEST